MELRQDKVKPYLSLIILYLKVLCISICSTHTEIYGQHVHHLIDAAINNGNVDSIRYLDLNREDSLTLRVIQGDNISYKDHLSVIKLLNKQSNTNFEKLIFYIDNYVKTPSNRETVDLDYVSLMSTTISELINQNRIEKASQWQDNLSSYLSSIELKGDDYKRAMIFLSNYDIVMNVIKKDTIGINICNENLSVAQELKDTNLIIQALFQKSDFIIIKGKLDEYIQNCEEAYRLDTLRKNKSGHFYKNQMHLVDALIYKGSQEKRAFDILSNLYNNHSTIHESYSYISKFLSSTIPFNEHSKRLFEMINVKNIDDYVDKTEPLAKQYLNGNDYYQYLRETTLALSKYGKHDRSNYLMEDAFAQLRILYSKDLAQSIASYEKKIVEQQKNNELALLESENKSIRKFTYLAIAVLLILLTLLLLVFYLFRKVKDQNQKLTKIDKSKNELLLILAHDLKGPIASFDNISKKVAFLIKNKDFTNLDKLSTYYENMGSALKYSVYNLLDWSISQKENLTLQKENINVEEGIHETLTQVEYLIKERKIDVKVDLEGDRPFNAFLDSTAFTVALRNIFHNAVKNSPNNSTIFIHVIKDNSHISIVTQNQGNQIDQPTLLKLNKDLNKNDQFFNLKMRDSGIGLATAKKLLLVNKSDFLVKNTNDGVQVTLRLPLQKSI